MGFSPARLEAIENGDDLVIVELMEIRVEIADPLNIGEPSLGVDAVEAGGLARLQLVSGMAPWFQGASNRRAKGRPANLSKSRPPPLARTSWWGGRTRTYEGLALNNEESWRFKNRA